MAAESGNLDPEQVERDAADLVHGEQERGADLDDAVYHRVPALAEHEESTPEELEERAKATLHAIPTPEQPSTQDEGEQDWPSHIEKQVDLGRISAGQADLMAGKQVPPPPAEDEAA